MTTRPPHVAISTALLQIPPTYFVTQHAEMLVSAGRLRAAAFPLAASIADAPTRVSITPALPNMCGPWDLRRKLAGLALGRQRSLLLSSDADLVHQHHAVWSVGAISAARRAGIPLIVTAHGADVYTASRPARSAMGRWHQHNTMAAFRSSAQLLVVSRHLADLAVRAGADAAHTRIHYQGIDTHAFTPGPARQGPPRILYVGTLTARKRVERAIDAARAAAEEGIELELHIVGSGPLEASLRARAAGLRSVHWHGPLPKNGVIDRIRDADVLVLPSYDEAAGLVLLEAQSCGVPVVVTAGDGKEEMLLDRETGSVVDAEAGGAALLDGIRPWIAPEALRSHEVAQRCREFVVRERSLQSGARKLAEIYADVLA